MEDRVSTRIKPQRIEGVESVEDFLKRGGKITQVPSNVFGEDATISKSVAKAHQRALAKMKEKK